MTLGSMSHRQHEENVQFLGRRLLFLHTLELVVREFMEDEFVNPWLVKIKGLCGNLKMNLIGWSCFEEMCQMRHVTIRRSDQVGRVSEYYTEGPNTVIWLMNFENPQLTGVGKCELNTWEWENSKVGRVT